MPFYNTVLFGAEETESVVMLWANIQYFAGFLLPKIGFREHCPIYGTPEATLYHTRSLWSVPSNPTDSQKKDVI